ncbi:hypothetical protein TNCV_2980201 [Trichonephila clavipes]|nr:hypothetical protein TNCV_2980201 [Trichonephila clavipes]
MGGWVVPDAVRDYDLDMALNQQSNMELEPHSPYSTSSTETAPLPCQELTSMKVYIRRLQIICNEKEKTISLLRLDHGHSEADSLYQLAWNEFQDIHGPLQQAMSYFDSLPPYSKPSYSHHISPPKTPPLVFLLHLPLGETVNINEKTRMISNFIHSEKL